MKGLNFFQLFTNRRKIYVINGNVESRELPCSTEEIPRESKRPTFGCRHFVALMGFGMFVSLNVHRMNMTISIVAMVKHSDAAKNSDTNSGSCPTEEYPISEVNHTEYGSEKNTGEFDWSPQYEGYILGCSFVGYSATQFVGGKVAEIFGCKWVIFCGLFVSSFCTLVTPFCAWGNICILIAVQTIRGMAQGMYQAPIYVLGANWFPAMERGCLFAFMMAGNGIGEFSGGLISGYLCHLPHLGWPSVFYFCGSAGVVLAVIVAVFLHESPSVHPKISDSELKFILNNQECKLTQRRPNTPWCSIFTSVPIYALSFAIFGIIWEGAHFLVVQPIFLDTILHFPIGQNGLFTSLPFLILSGFTLAASWVSNTLNKKKYLTVDKARKFWNLISCLGYSLCLTGIYFSACNRTLSIAFAFLSVAFIGFGYTGCLIVAADMSPTFSGSVMGLTYTIGSMSGFILPMIVGFLTDGMEIRHCCFTEHHFIPDLCESLMTVELMKMIEFPFSLETSMPKTRFVPTDSGTEAQRTCRLATVRPRDYLMISLTVIFCTAARVLKRVSGAYLKTLAAV